MNCDECKERPATVHLTKVVNGERVEARLCEQCAREKGDFPGFMGGFAIPAFNFANLLSGILHTDNPSRGADTGTNARCECGFTYQDFSKNGKLGCEKCYTTFGDRVGPMLRRIHGSTAHIGKVPSRASGRIRLRRDLDDLRQALQRMIAEEKYEEAAGIRDQIRTLERRISGE